MGEFCSCALHNVFYSYPISLDYSNCNVLTHLVCLLLPYRFISSMKFISYLAFFKSVLKEQESS